MFVYYIRRLLLCLNPYRSFQSLCLILPWSSQSVSLSLMAAMSWWAVKVCWKCLFIRTSDTKTDTLLFVSTLHTQNIGQASDQTVSQYKPTPASHSHLLALCLRQCICICVLVLNVTWISSKDTFVNDDEDDSDGVHTEINRRVSCPSAAVVLIDLSAGTGTLTLSIWRYDWCWCRPLSLHHVLYKAKQEPRPRSFAYSLPGP